jgi:hypothetical protein
MTAIIVLAQGRTGSSAVAGVLHHLGVYMGEGLLPSTPDNAKGSFEDMWLWQKLTDLAGDWKEPKFTVGKMREFRPEWQDFVKRMEKHELWGVKAPLLCFALTYLEEDLPKDTRFILPLRPPDAAIKSLTKVAGVGSEDEAKTIFWRYTEALVSAEMGLMEKWSRLPVLYDDLVEYPKDTVAKIAKFCGLDPNQAAVEFVDEKLRHWQ